MSVRMPPSPQRAAAPGRGAIQSKNPVSDSKSGFDAVLNSSNQAQKEGEKSEGLPNILRHELLNSSQRISDRKEFLNDSAELLGMHPFSFMPITDPKVGSMVQMNGIVGLQTSDQAHQLLSQALNASTESRSAMNAIRLSNETTQSAMFTEASTDTPLKNQPLSRSELKSALNQLKANSLMARLAGASTVVKHSIVELSQQWGNEIISADSKNINSRNSFQPLSVASEHSPAEQLQAAVKAVASSFDGPEMMASRQNIVDASATLSTMNSSSSAATNSVIRQPSMSLQIAMASHMDVDLPHFASQLKRLSLQIQDPAGVMLLEIVKDAQELHVRAVIPQEAMEDLQNLESDLRQQLGQQGLDLGSFEMYSQGDQDSNGEGDSKQSSNTDNKSDSIQLSDAILDRRI